MLAEVGRSYSTPRHRLSRLSHTNRSCHPGLGRTGVCDSATSRYVGRCASFRSLICFTLAVKDDYLDEKLNLVATLRPLGLLEPSFISPSGISRFLSLLSSSCNLTLFPDSEFVYMLGQSFSAKEPVLRRVHAPVVVRLPLQVQFYGCERILFVNRAFLHNSSHLRRIY